MNRSSLPAPTPDAAAHTARVAAHLRAVIERAGGWIGFDRYMHEVLYAPGLGYYTAGTRKFGDSATGGDFVTAPEISPLFAQALAAQLAQLFTVTAPRVLEFGAGSGALAQALLAELSRRGVALAGYQIVEVAADLRERQQQRLHGLPVSWLETPPADFDGVMIANEVLDVMPVQLFIKRDGVVFERGVVRRDDGFGFEERPAGEAIINAVRAIETEVGTLPDGYASELGMVARGWSASIAQWLKRGALLAIDYGFPRREYYHPQRLMGTIMCHYRHHAHADPFWLPGLNDLTAHVDFTAVAEAAHVAGLEVLGYTTQAHFLLNCGLLDVLKQDHSHRRANEAHRLLSEAEMGELFKVIALGRGVELPLVGFQRGDRTHTL